LQSTTQIQARVNMLAGGSLVGVFTTVLGLLLLWKMEVSGVWVALFLCPILIIATAPALARQAARERDRSLLWLLLLALVLKLLGSLVRYFVAFRFYGGSVDAVGYHEFATELAERFRAGNFDTEFDSLTGTNFIQFFTGVLYTVIGPSIHAGFLLYSWLAFWGLFYLYRAFTIAMPEGNRRAYARLLFFLPSILYWPSALGKDAWMLFALGLAAYGAARVLTGPTLRGLVTVGVGLWLATLVRPHVAGMAGLGLAVAFMTARVQRRPGRRRSAIMKVLAMAGLIALGAVLLSQTAAFLKDNGLDPEDGVSSVLAETTRRTSVGDSKFTTSSSGSFSPLQFPMAMVTILFRPFLFEAHNAQMLITAIESTLLLGLTLSRARPIGRAIRNFRRLPYVTFVVVYGALFALAFSSIANFGILARERAQLLPFFLVLLAVPGAGRRRSTTQSRQPLTRSFDADRQLARA
jgi:hypothetical protein